MTEIVIGMLERRTVIPFSTVLEFITESIGIDESRKNYETSTSISIGDGYETATFCTYIPPSHILQLLVDADFFDANDIDSIQPTVFTRDDSNSGGFENYVLDGLASTSCTTLHPSHREFERLTLNTRVGSPATN